MSSKPVVLFEAVSPLAAATTLYTSPDKVLSIVEKFSCCNDGAGVVSVTVNIVASGGAVAGGNRFVKEKALAVGESYGFPEIVGQKLAPGDFISVTPSGVGLNFRGSGTQVTV